MALILAIEPDRQQASRLSALARGPLDAELVVAESTQRAFEALGPRVPDLILTSLLLSPKDEAALAERLRELDGSGARVQTLVIPVLASSQRRSSAKSGLRSLLRRQTQDSAPDGCDPAVFAAQISEYLRNGAAERARLVERQEDQRHRESRARKEAPPAPTESVEEPLHDRSAVPALGPAPSGTEQPTFVESLDQEAPDWNDRQPESAIEFDSLRWSPPEASGQSPTTSDQVAPIEESEAEPIDEAPEELITVENVDLAAFVRELEAAANYMGTVARPPESEQQAQPMSRDQPERPTADDLPHSADLDDDIATFLAALPKPAYQGDHESPERDAEVAATSNLKRRPAPRRREKARTPVPEEWSFFDPEHCGFSALLARLDELAGIEQSSAPGARSPSAMMRG